ncbi:hypothetical protein AJ79_04454 [Helicocarpus griseus UAMH5409]|uniref:Elongator complex protein 6 n=1 Tax=Helicocarpus griseus UAMH5409 TaxID=1447875 RepID=A0A2B7XT46_9EURO|nr:hypothetical protein AJ79_04454 [Helicocarpus griseus UAMH5409]
MPPPTAPILAPYTASPFPAHSLTLITSVLGATSNWLVLRILCDALSSGSGVGDEFGGVGGVRGRRVVFMSFLRGWEFWRGEGRRVGLDLSRLSNEGSFTFIDGVSELFLPAQSTGEAPSLSGVSTSSTLPIRGPAQPARGPVSATRARVPATQQRSGSSSSSSNSSNAKKLQWSTKVGLDALVREVASAIDDVSGNTASDERPVDSETLLVIDQPDLLLAATGPGMGVGAVEMGEFVMGLREADGLTFCEKRVHSTVVTLAADSPLIHTALAESAQQQPTPLEKEHASLVVGMAHQARMVMQLRGLDTGVARDVSGVLRISKGGGYIPATGNGDKRDDYGQVAGLEEKEVLYFVQGDGAVRVFGRGE